MIIEKNNFTMKAMAFADGADGYFRQEYELHYDGEKLGITVLREGSRKVPHTRVFLVGVLAFDDLKNAVTAAGHTWAVPE